MTFDLADWRVQVDVDATRRHTSENASDHCDCAYCRNFYETLPNSYPGLCAALSRLGIDPMGPCELMPFTPNLYLACYRLQGKILRWGRSELEVLEKQLDERFYRAGRSLIVNLTRVSRVTRETIRLLDGTCLPLPRGAYEGVNRAIIQLR